jgi:hypothetical protein
MMEADLIVNGILIFSFIFTPIPRWSILSSDSVGYSK